MDLKQLATDSEKNENGIWMPYEDAEFRIASAHSRRYREALAAQIRKVPQHARQSLPAMDKATIEAMATGVLLDFRGVKNNGVDLENTRENRIAILQIPQMREWIADQAQALANFQEEGLRADLEDMKSEPPVEA